MIPVTKPFLPPKEEYLTLLDGIWQRNWLTNHGPLVSELELRLKDYLNINHILFLSSGTSALQVAIKALDLKGEIITTPFSYVATATSILWENCSPVFVDINAEDLTIDVSKIETKISDKTSAIIATHVFGIPCNVEVIEKIASKNNLKVIYDGAHSFGVNYGGKSIYEFGDISIASFHATKLFHTIEGGAVITNSPELLKKMALLRNFGHTGPYTFEGIGINAKNSEFHAAMGICNLRYINDIIEKRKLLSLQYNNLLKDLDLVRPKVSKDVTYNFSYYPVIFESPQETEKVINELEANYIFPRRYFYPSLDAIHGNSDCPISIDISSRVLCLPLYHDLSLEEQNLVCRLIKRAIRY